MVHRREMTNLVLSQWYYGSINKMNGGNNCRRVDLASRGKTSRSYVRSAFFGQAGVLND